MADRWVLDTNVYIKALRNRQDLADLKRFHIRARARLLVSAVVALELRAGALTAGHAAAVDDLVKVYADRERVIVPSFDAYTQAGRVLAALATKERMPLAEAPRSLVNDVILAWSCRESDVVLVTENARDFSMIQRQLKGFRFLTTLPE